MQNVNVPGAMAPKVKCDLPQKCLVQIPSKFAIEMTNRGWILRNEIIWHKPSCMPSPATDRFTVDFEKMFFFTKKTKYYFKQQFEPIKESSLIRAEYGWDGTHAPGRSCNPEKGVKMGERWANPKGRNKRTVWSINTASFKGAHFAVYPPELIESPIDAGCPLYVCTKCEKPREVILESLPNPKGISGRAGKPMVSKDGVVDNNDGTRLESGHNPTQFTNSKFVGYTDCGCGNSEFIETPIDAGCPEYVDKKTGEARERVIKKKSLERHELPKDNPNYRPSRYKGKYDELHGGNSGQRYAVYDDEGYNDDKKDSEFKPGVVLDPFFGSGTTAEVAMKQGKDWVGIDLNDEYIGISEKRLKPTIKEKKTRDKANEFWE
jgi:DNA modification methylase